METEAKPRQIKVRCPEHYTTFDVDCASKIYCDTKGHALSNDFPNEKFWEYCCDCQIFSPSNLEVGGTVKVACIHCERPTTSRFVCGNCKIVSNDSGEDTKGKNFNVSFDSQTIEPSCPGCLETFSEVKLHLHKCEEAQAVFLTSRPICPFCKKETVRSTKKQSETEKLSKNCPKCKSLNPINAPFCENCGETLRSDITGVKRGTSEPKTQLLGSICPNCGNPNTPDSIFCPECGQSLKAGKKTAIPVAPISPLPAPIQTPAINNPDKINPAVKPGLSSSAKGCLAVVGVLFGSILLCAIFFQKIKDSKSPNSNSYSTSYNSYTSNTTTSNSYNTGNYSNSMNSTMGNFKSGLPDSFDRTYTGIIEPNGKSALSFTMKLKREGNKLTGTASTLKKTDDVEGEIDDSGAFTLKAFGRKDYENVRIQTGTFEGQIDSDGSIEGNWTDMQGGSKSPFSLTQD